MGVWRSYADKRHIEWQLASTKKCRNFAKEDRDIVGSSLVDSLTDVSTDEEVVEFEGVFDLYICVGCVSFGVEMDDFHISNLGSSGYHGIDEQLRERAHPVDVNAVT